MDQELKAFLGRRQCGRSQCVLGNATAGGWCAASWRRRSAWHGGGIVEPVPMDSRVADPWALVRQKPIVPIYASECPAGAQPEAQSHAGDDQSSLEAVPLAFELGPY
jgi:hypothetical protein